MASLLPKRSSIDHTPRDHSDVVVRRDDPTDVLGVLSSDTAQTIVGALRDEPSTASEIAETVDTSLQNVEYHLQRLCDADLVEPVDTWYSARGTPMTVYALAAERLVVRFGADDRPSGGSPAD